MVETPAGCVSGRPIDVQSLKGYFDLELSASLERCPDTNLPNTKRCVTIGSNRAALGLDSRGRLSLRVNFDGAEPRHYTSIGIYGCVLGTENFTGTCSTISISNPSSAATLLG